MDSIDSISISTMLYRAPAERRARHEDRIETIRSLAAALPEGARRAALWVAGRDGGEDAPPLDPSWVGHVLDGNLVPIPGDHGRLWAVVSTEPLS